MKSARLETIRLVCLCLFLRISNVASECVWEGDTLKECDPNPLVPKVATKIEGNVTCDATGRAKTTLGETYELKIHFKPKMDHQTVTATAVVEAFGLKIPVMKPEDLCKGGFLPCPLRADQTYTLSQIFPFATNQPIFTPMKVTLDFSLKDGKTPIFCVKIPLEVHPKPNRFSLLFSGLLSGR